MTAPAIELDGIDKSFGSVHAVRGVSMAIGKGAITGIVGESLIDAMEGDSGGQQILVIVVLLLVSVWGIYRFFTKRNARSS